MRRSVLAPLLLVVFLGPSTAQADRTFNWAIVDTLSIETNPTYVQSCLDLTPAGEPVRAHLLRNKLLTNAHYLGDYRLAHYDQAGSVLWSTVLEGKVHVEDLQVDSSGAIVLHGVYVDSLVVDPEHMLLDLSGDRRPYLLKLDAAHQVEWLIDLQADDPSIDEVFVIAVDANDQVWVGTSRILGNSEIVRLDANGEVAETYVQSEAPFVTGLSVDSNGTVWASGFCSDDTVDFNGMMQACPFTYAMYLVKYAPDGQAEWAHFIEDVTFQLSHVLSDGYGNVYFAGELFGVFDFGGLLPEGVDWVYDFFLCKVDADGNFLWLREVPADGFSGDASIGKSAFLACRGDSLVYFSGYSRGSVDWVGDGDPPPDWGGPDLLVLEYSADGECHWAKTAGSDWVDIADAIGVDDQGNVFIAGSVHEDAVFDGMFFPGNFINSYIASLPAENAAAAPEDFTPALTARLNVYPSPFNPSARVTFRIAEPGPLRVTVHDLRGGLVATLASGHHRSGEHTVEWDGRDAAGRALPSGVYLCRLETASGVLGRRLVMLR